MMRLDHAPEPGCEGGALSTEGGLQVDLDLMLHSALKLQEVADKLNVSVRQVQGYVSKGELAAFDVGEGLVRASKRVLEVDLEGFIARRRLRITQVRPFDTPEPSRPKPLSPRPKFSEIRAARKARASR